jgi:myo-inositol-1(or 4)-monophosphatase
MRTEAELRPETRTLIAALRASRELIEQRRGAGEVTEKGVNDIVTATDVLVQDRLERVLREQHPEIIFIGEEGTGSAGAHLANRRWLVDPICGTTNYAVGLPWFATNVALVENGVVTAAGVADGATGDIWIAEKGGGAFHLEADGLRPIRVSSAYGIVSVDPTVSPSKGMGDFATSFALRVIARRTLDVRVISSTIALALVATGRLAAAVYASEGMGLHVAAGALLAREAGARVSDHTGAVWTPSASVLIVAASTDLHAQLQSLAAEVVAEVTAPG